MNFHTVYVELPLESFGLLPLVVFVCFLILAFTKEDGGDFKNGDGSLFSPSRPLRQRLAHDQPLRDSYDRRLLACSVKYRILISNFVWCFKFSAMFICIFVCRELSESTLCKWISREVTHFWLFIFWQITTLLINSSASKLLDNSQILHYSIWLFYKVFGSFVNISTDNPCWD